MKLTGILKNPIVKAALKSAFTSGVKDGKLHGVYAYLDEQGDIQLREYSTDPEHEISKLKKLLYE